MKKDYSVTRKGRGDGLTHRGGGRRVTDARKRVGEPLT